MIDDFIGLLTSLKKSVQKEPEIETDWGVSNQKDKFDDNENNYVLNQYKNKPKSKKKAQNSFEFKKNEQIYENETQSIKLTSSTNPPVTNHISLFKSQNLQSKLFLYFKLIIFNNFFSKIFYILKK